MRIGLIDVDGHNFPNLALMRIAAYHKRRGDSVEWWFGMGKYERVYMSKVFSAEYTADLPEPLNADEVIKGGTGYCIELENGVEKFKGENNTRLPKEIENQFPDYSVYPQYDFCVSKTSEGCPRGCAFCHVQAKEGCKSVQVAEVSDFWREDIGKRKISVCDPNILACRDAIRLLNDYKNTGALIDYNQGLDIRLMSDEAARIISQTRIEQLHFAWDSANDDLTPMFEKFGKRFNRGTEKHGGNGTVYCLTNFERCGTDEHIERLLYRALKLREMGYRPFCMVYNRPHADKKILELQRWCNEPRLFYTCSFDEYKHSRAKEQQPITGQSTLWG